MTIDEIIRLRRSHFPKDFTGQAVPDAVVNRMLENARWAPSHKLTMPWRLHCVAGEAKNQLCRQMEDYYLQFTPSESFNQQKLDKIRRYPQQVSHIISVGMSPTGLVPEWEELAATAMAVQNMWLTLSEEPHAAGYWSSGNGTGTATMKAATGLAATDLQLGFFMLGMVQEKRYEAKR